MVCLLRIYKKYLSHFIDTVTWVAAHGISHPKISERETTHLARTPDIDFGSRASHFSVAGGSAAGVI